MVTSCLFPCTLLHRRLWVQVLRTILAPRIHTLHALGAHAHTLHILGTHIHTLHTMATHNYTHTRQEGNDRESCWNCQRKEEKTSVNNWPSPSGQRCQAVTDQTCVGCSSPLLSWFPTAGSGYESGLQTVQKNTTWSITHSPRTETGDMINFLSHTSCTYIWALFSYNAGLVN